MQIKHCCADCGEVLAVSPACERCATDAAAGPDARCRQSESAGRRLNNYETNR